MKTKKTKSLLLGLSFTLVVATALSACKLTTCLNNAILSLTGNKNGNVLTASKNNTRLSTSGTENDSTDFTDEYIIESVPGDENDSQLEFWKINEFEEWMEHQRTENQKLSDSGDKTFYYKNANGDYVCREWTQEDVDALYAQWQEQLTLMKQGYHFTKTITFSDGDVLVGTFDPEKEIYYFINE